MEQGGERKTETVIFAALTHIENNKALMDKLPVLVVHLLRHIHMSALKKNKNKNKEQNRESNSHLHTEYQPCDSIFFETRVARRV
jgi:hypothetical protein